MLQHLLESDARRERRRGWVEASVAAHVAALALAIAATGRAAEGERPRAPAERVVFQAPPAPAPPARPLAAPAHRAAAGSTRSSAPVAPSLPRDPLPTVDLSSLVPGIPPVDLSRPVVDPSEFDRRARGRTGGGGGGEEVGPGGGPRRLPEVDRPAAPLPGARPRYPEALRTAGVEGRVLVQFVVDTAGRVEPGSARVLAATHALFADAVERVLPSLRFVPAEAGGRRVRQLVEQPFEFAIAR